MQQAPTRLHWIRKFHGLTLQQLSALSSLSFVTVQNAERQGIASGRSLEKLAKALGASPDRLLDRGWDLASAVERDYSESAKRRGEGEAGSTAKRVALDLQMLSASR